VDKPSALDGMIEMNVRTRLDLYDLPKRLMDAVARSNVDLFADCFTDDACWDPRPLFRASSGKDDIRAAFKEACGQLSWAFQGGLQTIIDHYTGTQARMRTYLMELAAPKGETHPAFIGLAVYVDEAVMIGDRWKLRSHTLAPIYFGPNGFGPAVHPNQVVGT
jgi:ketosteroid isomerase-like protein